MKTVTKLSLVLIIALAINGCGGGSGGKSSNTQTNPIGNTTNTTNSTGNQTNPEGNTTKHPYSYGYACEGNVAVNGYTLPPCPDPKINDETLLGIDTNNNGVRDDVERWLITRYKNDHKIVTEIGFQTARAAQEIVISSPSEAKEVDKIMDKADDCNYYFEDYADIYGDPILINHTIITSTAYKTIQFNTEQRIKAYLAYDRALGGGVYRLTPINELKAQCDFDVNTLLGE
jgi:hypothetical protein